ncbi:MAG: type 1 glutamine amidotransferase [Candidatus Omnitrophica bacterium]|nr:type 1 glutamine amidotransferase [Candidatus Omnitrophota bacterium]
MSRKKKIAVLIEDHYQDLEVWYPILRLREAGYEVVTIEPRNQKHYVGKWGYPIDVDRSIDQVKPEEFDAVVIPGGWAPDKLRMSEKILNFVRTLNKQGKVVASICHGGWVLASAGVCKGRTLTSYIAIKDDLVNAGATFVDQEVIRDGNLITSRKPDDLPAFCRTILEALES